MKSFILIFVVLIMTSCSFDNKTGIWKDASSIPVDGQVVKSVNENDSVSRYEDIFIQDKPFNKEKAKPDNYVFKVDSPIQTQNWLEQYGSKTNNISNFSYSGNNILLSKSSKLSKLTSSKNIIFYKNILIGYDQKGRIFFYSLYNKQKEFEYDFYKKSFKNFKKVLYLTTSEDMLYAADNLGYIYAIDIYNKTLVWAKNYGVPFRSNLKVVNGQILVANQDNVIYSINVKTGDKNWQFATSLTFLKSDFNNSFAIDEINKNLFFLNTSGELYSINYGTQNVNWVLNFKNPTLAGDTDLFLSQPIVLKNKNLIISTEKSIINFDFYKGSKKWGFPSNTIIKPILTTDYTFILSKNNLLICIENMTGDVIWSKNIYNNLDKKFKNKIGEFYDFKVVNGELYLFTNNGFLLSYNYNDGNLKFIKKISKKGITSEVVFIQDSMFLIDAKNKLLKFN
jgi:outer membrane protein assembly factor BamB